MTPFLQADIERDEGFRSVAYPDPDSPLAKHLAALDLVYVPGDEKRFPNLSPDPWTVAFGETGSDVTAGTTRTLAQGQAWLQQRLVEICAELDRNIPWWRDMNDPRQDVFANLGYSLGWPRLSAFKNTLSLAKAGIYVTAGKALLASKAAVELPKRYQRLAAQLSTGVRAP